MIREVQTWNMEKHKKGKEMCYTLGSYKRVARMPHRGHMGGVPKEGTHPTQVE